MCVKKITFGLLVDVLVKTVKIKKVILIIQ